MFAILWHHHAIEPDLYGDCAGCNGVLFAHDGCDDGSVLLVARRHRPRQSPDGRVAQRGRPYLVQKVGRLVLGHARQRLGRDARKPRRVRPLDHSQPQVQRHR
jgi:hypothetical protein